MYKQPPRRSLRLSFVSVLLVVVVLLFALCNIGVQPIAERHYTNWLKDQPLITADKPLQDLPLAALEPPPDCRTLNGANDVLLVMKTGATEILKKLPVHLETTFKCTPKFTIFSDVGQMLGDLEIHDALDHMKDIVDKNTDEWRFYEQLNAVPEKNASIMEGMSHDEAWKLDKFKNIPMIRKSYKMHPDVKWFVTIDADTAIIWPTLLKWLEKFDHTKPYYMGSQALIGDMEFAHGGSGYVLSKAAAKLFFEEEHAERDKHLRFAMETCCGDLTIANAMLDHGVHLTRSWPIIQGETPSTLDFGDSHWCYPTISWHHVNAKEIEEIWAWQQRWLLQRRKGVQRYEDAFNEFVWPNLTDERTDWDNMSKDEVIREKEKKEEMSDRDKLAVASFAGCREACLEIGDCYQFSWAKGVCGLGKKIRLGTAEEGIKSGWNIPRIEKWKMDQSRANCSALWIDPEHP